MAWCPLIPIRAVRDSPTCKEEAQSGYKQREREACKRRTHIAMLLFSSSELWQLVAIEICLG